MPPALLIFAVSETLLLKDSLIKVGAVDIRKVTVVITVRIIVSHSERKCNAYNFKTCRKSSVHYTA
jgi:hypothetical protein